jgi:hypothetical protein
MADIGIRWNARYRSWRIGNEGMDETTDIAKTRASNLMAEAVLKLMCGTLETSQIKDQTLAIMSQRVCLDLVMNQDEARKLAYRSVSHYMRILVGYDELEPIFHTVSPSEPMLALAAFKLMHEEQRKISQEQKTNVQVVMGALSEGLCGKGMIEKDMVGELCVRVLLILARDFTVLRQGRNWEEALKPVRVLDVLETLLRDGWAGDNKKALEDAFGDGYVNYTHWITTDDMLPVEPNV